MTKVKKISRNLAIATLCAPLGVQALSIGELQLHSALNQNFSADIPLIASPGENVENIEVKLASDSAFKKAGIERGYLLSSLRFKPKLNENGTLSVKVNSRDAIREPFLTFLVEVKWPEGRMLKEYTVLLDPPNFINQPVIAVAPPQKQVQPVVGSAIPEPASSVQTAASQAVATDTGSQIDSEESLYGEELYPEYNTPNGQQVQSQSSSRDVPLADQAPQQTQTKTTQAPTSVRSNPVASQNLAVKGDLAVAKGTSLWSVAESMRDQYGVNQNQMMMALYKTNPEAFYGKNINALRAGAVLKAPDKAIFASLDSSLKDVKQHNKRWNDLVVAATEQQATSTKATQRGSLKLAAPQQSTASQEDQGQLEKIEALLSQVNLMSEENTDLRSQVGELQASITELKQQLESTSATEQLVAQQQVDDLESQLNEATKAVETRNIQQAAGEKVLDPIALAGDKSTVTEQGIDTPGEPAQGTENLQLTQAEGTDIQTAADTTAAASDITAPVIAADTTIADKAEVTQPLVKQATPVRKPLVVTPAKVAEESSFFSELMDSPMALGSIAGTAAILLGLLGFQSMRRRKKELEEEWALDEQMLEDEKDEVANPSGFESEGLGASENNSELGDSVFFSEYRPTEAQMDTKALEVDHNDLDPLSEADVYIAYGRYQQAEDLINEAMGLHPERNEYKLKLFEIYQAKEDSAAFTAYVTQLKDEGMDNDRDFWAKVQEIGADIAPENLFGDTTSDQENSELDEFSSDLFGMDGDNATFALNDDLSAILGSETEDSLDVSDAVDSAETVDATDTMGELETAFALNELNTETLLISDADEIQSSELLMEDFQTDVNLGDLSSSADVDSAGELETTMFAGATDSSDDFSSMHIDFEAAISDNLSLDSDKKEEVAEESVLETQVDTSDWELDVESSDTMDAAAVKTVPSVDNPPESSFLSTELLESMEMTKLPDSVQAIYEESVSFSLDSETGSEAMSSISLSEELDTLSAESTTSMAFTELMEQSSDEDNVVSFDLDSLSTDAGTDGSAVSSSAESTSSMEFTEFMGQSSDDDNVVSFDLDSLSTDSGADASTVSSIEAVSTEFDAAELESVQLNEADSDAGIEFSFDPSAEASSEMVETVELSEMLEEAARQSEDNDNDDSLYEAEYTSELFTPASLMVETEVFESELSMLDEVADKLDLAKAYIDMEDAESARTILNEVVVLGTDEQKEQAKGMIQSLEKTA